MDIPAGVVQYPKAEDTVAGQPVSYSLLMSFNDIEERAESEGIQGVHGRASAESTGHGCIAVGGTLPEGKE
jgi:hypothetical protein